MDLSPHPHLRRKLQFAARTAGRHLPDGLPPVLVFTDPHRSADPLELARALPEGWGLVYRHFGNERAGEIAGELSRLSRTKRTMLLIGADVALARWAGAHGVHWPQSGLAPTPRDTAGFAFNTMSAHAPADLSGPQPPGIAARVFSVVFPSASPSAGPACGPLRARRAASAARLPVYGLGGIDHDTAGRIATVMGLAGVGRFEP